MRLANGNGEQSSSDRLSPSGSRKASTTGRRLILAVVKPFNAATYGIRRWPIGDAVRYCQSRRLRNDESPFKSLNCRPVLGDASTRDRAFCWWRSESGERAWMLGQPRRVYNNTRYASIAEHPFMPPIARTMIVPRLAA